ncbi:MAG TPA: AI-2E family transporter [Pyrinomonadaceae bacterium]|nr:AI-2E family transporter [Pyrinomonadaceae bacterium]
MTSNDNNITEFTKKVLIVVGVVLAAILITLFIYYTIDVVLLLFGAVLLAIFLRGLADLLNRYTNISEGLTVLLVSVLLVGILAGAIALLAPSIAEQVRHLRQELPVSAQKVGNYISQFGWGKTLIEQLPSADDIMKKVDAASVLSSVGGYFSSTVGALGNLFVMILLAIYLATEPRFYANGFTKLFPIKSRPRVFEVLSEIGTTLSWWLIGKVASMIFIGLLTWIGLWILGVPLSLTLGLIAGLLSFIPNFGPILSAVPAILLAFIESPISALYVLILFVVVQIIESNLVTPFIERQTVELPPALTVFAQLALSILIGGVGLILATPLLAVIVVLVQSVYIEDVLGDKNTEVNENLAESGENFAQVSENSEEKIQLKAAKPRKRKTIDKKAEDTLPE